jgi:hypothetical protein
MYKYGLICCSPPHLQMRSGPSLLIYKYGMFVDPHIYKCGLICRSFPIYKCGTVCLCTYVFHRNTPFANYLRGFAFLSLPHLDFPNPINITHGIGEFVV